MATAVAERPVVDAAEPDPLMSHRQIMFVMYGLMAGMFLSALDQTIVGTAIRTIGDDLHGLDQQAWVTTAYLIAATVTTPLYGKLSDIFGRRPLFIISISIFVAGSFLSTFSTSMLTLAAFRAFQGLGAGGLMSLPLAIIGDMLAPRERARYQGFFLATFGVASVIGPLVGGLFAGTDTILGIAGWRWVFLVNVPVGIVALIMVFTFLHLPHLPHGKARIDWWGASQAATGAKQLASGASQVSQGLGQVSGATNAAAEQSQQATADYAAVQQALGALAKDQQDCEAGDDDACSHESGDTAALQDAVKTLGTSVYTTSGYLNGSDSKPGIASGLSGLASGADSLATGAGKLAGGLSQLATGTDKLASGAQTAADSGAAIPEGLGKVTDGSAKLGEGAGKLSTIEQTIDDKVAELLPDAVDEALAKVADEKHLSVSGGRLTVDWSDPAQRSAMLDELTPALIDQIKAGTGDTAVQTDASTSDTSFLTGADSRLTKPFMLGFNESVVTIYWCGLAVMLLAFVITLLYRVPALRTRSALQERADLQKETAWDLG